MPEMLFVVRWPDGRVENCYSPSLVMHDHLLAGTSYPVADFVDRTGTALGRASDRVRAKYGFECTSAIAQQREIEAVAAGFTAPDARVEVLAMTPPLPSDAPVAPGAAATPGPARPTAAATPTAATQAAAATPTATTAPGVGS